MGDNISFLSDAFHDLLKFSKGCSSFIQGLKTGPVESGPLERLASLRDETDLEFFEQEVPLAINQTSEGVERVSKIVRSMKEFSHPGGKSSVLTDINRALDNTITVARNEWKYVADLTCDLDPSLPLVLCNPGELNQVFLNMIINASLPVGGPHGRE